jgi:hypothetical protein
MLGLLTSGSPSWVVVQQVFHPSMLSILACLFLLLSGMSAAFALSMHPDMFDVTLYERSSSVGGMATSTDIDQSKYGASYINDGVQGASPVFYNTYAVFDRLGFQASKVGMQVSFGKDAEKEFWSNVFPSRVIDKYVWSQIQGNTLTCVWWP